MRDIFKALASDVRLQMLDWLKQPELNFPPSTQHGGDAHGVCVSHIQDKAGLSASATSTHLAILQRAGLVTATRYGQWTYYKRDEAAIQALARAVETAL